MLSRPEPNCHQTVQQSLKSSPDVDPSSPSADAWFVDSWSPSDVVVGDEVTLKLKSVLEQAVHDCDAGEIGDAGATLLIDMAGEDFGSGDLDIEDVVCLLNHLDTPDATINKMSQTRSLDGRQEDDWDGVAATWSYHPDNGLDIIVELID